MRSIAINFRMKRDGSKYQKRGKSNVPQHHSFIYEMRSDSSRAETPGRQQVHRNSNVCIPYQLYIFTQCICTMTMLYRLCTMRVATYIMPPQPEGRPASWPWPSSAYPASTAGTRTSARWSGTGLSRRCGSWTRPAHTLAPRQGVS